MKHEWRKKEKQFYLPKTKPAVITIPAFNFIMIKGQGSPESKMFSECIEGLYAMSYSIKMMLKKRDDKPSAYIDYTVYPLEGIWDISDEAKKERPTSFRKEDFVYTLMIRQPSFISNDIFENVLHSVKKKKPNLDLDRAHFRTIAEGKCCQMLHIGSFDEEPATFEVMEKFTKDQGLNRKAKGHREIYLSDFRKVPVEKLKTVLRFQVE
jgi:hypothetical protein